MSNISELATKHTPTVRKAHRLAANHWQIVVIVLAFGFIGSFALLRSFAATAELYLSPATFTTNVGGDIVVAVRVKPEVAIDTVEAKLSYDPSLLQFVSADGSTSSFPTEIASQGDSGTVNLARTALAPLTIANDSLVANVTFRALSSTTGTPIAISGNIAYQGNLVTPATTGARVVINGAPAPALSDTTAPTVTIASPANGTVGNKFTVNATASDAVQVTSVELYIDDKLTTTSATTSLKYVWDAKSKTIAKGSHTITVKAYDSAGNGGSATTTVRKR